MKTIENIKESYLGSDIKRWCESNAEDIESARILLDIYWNPDKSHAVNEKVYYFITVEEGTVSLVRDLEKSPRRDDLQLKELKELVNSDSSILGKELIELCKKEVATGKSSENFLEFFKTIILGTIYSPKENVYYSLKYNTAGHYYMKRDLLRSPKKIA